MHTDKNGNKYFGQWDPDTKLYSGQGIYVWAKHGSIYEGNWEHGKRNGMGRRLYNAGDLYEGLWKDGVAHGKGINILPNKTRYIGEYRNGYLNGKGMCIKPNKSKYIGDYKDSYRHGYGVMINRKTGARYEGYWKNDKKHGQAVSHLGKGKYIGQYYQGKCHGKGVDIRKDGSVADGIWRRGIFQG